MDHMLGSKWQITELIRHGFNVKVTRYKQSTVVKECVNDIIKRYCKAILVNGQGIMSIIMSPP